MQEHTTRKRSGGAPTNTKEGKKTGCKTPHVVDADIEHAFVDALATRITGNAGARCTLRILEETVFDTRPLEAERDKALQEAGEITVLIDQLLASATNTRLDSDEFDNEYANLTARYEEATATRERLNAEITDKQARLAQARATADYLDARPPLEYSDDAWPLLVDHVRIETDGEITVIFKGLPAE
ncbi:Uncharacterised protein [Chlamydia trachomatis]|nr:Uncharacterised protein [Chlamydia trachomatis]CRH91071.1 Uncharacterised protein [Chlamydia trachomatis]